MVTHRDLKLMNEAMIEYLKSKNMDNSRNIIIDDILSDEACFFKMDKEDAFIVLEDIGVGKSKLEKIYNELVNRKTYEKLIQSNVLDQNDEELKIKF